MTSLTNWLSPDLMHSLGWALLHFMWQGTALAAVAAVLMAICRRSSMRYAVAVGMLALMLAAPIATFFFVVGPGASGSGQASPGAVVWKANPARSEISERQVSEPQLSEPQASKAFLATPRLDTFAWLVETWLMGVTLFSLRAAGGLLLLQRKRRNRCAAVSARLLDICQRLELRLGLTRVIRYCECEWLQAPAVIGWFRPMVLLPVTALTGLSEDQLRSVIAHELAHIRRFDAFVNVFQIAVETLLFYHPAVWWLSKRIRVEREHCCDEVAVSICGNAVEYARALTLMEEWRVAPGLAMAANRGPLRERIFRVLGLTAMGTGIRSIGLAGSLLCLTAALAAGNTLLGLARPQVATLAKHAAFLPAQAQAAASPAQPAAKPAPTPAAKPTPARPQAEAQPAPQATSYIEGIKAAGLRDVTVDELIDLKIQGVTPEYIRGLREQGLHPGVEGLVALKVQGVTPEYVSEMRGLGLKADEEQIVALKVQGVDPAYVRGFKDLGFQTDADDLVALKVQGVTPAYVHGLQEQGLHPRADDVIAMRVQGVTPEYIRDIRALGFNPSADEIVAMRVQGVTAEYIKMLQSAGFKLSVDDIIEAKVQGITPEFIEQARKHGFQNLSIEKLIQLKYAGVLEPQADI